MVPTGFLALLLLPWIWQSASAALTAAVISCVFGATAGAHFSNGSPVLLSICAMLPVVWHAAKSVHSLGWRKPSFSAVLLCLLLWAAVLTYFAPRLLAGLIEVIPNSQVGTQAGKPLRPLEPSAGNLNQFMYLVFAAVTCLSAYQLTVIQDKAETLSNAFLAAGAVNLLVTFLQALHLYAGLPYLLEGIANAGYVVYIGDSMAGLKRLSGAFSESSSYSGFSLALMAILASLSSQGFKPRVTGSVAAATLVAILLSTSSTGYLGLALLIAGHGLVRVVRMLNEPRQVRIGVGVVIVWAALTVGVVCMAWTPLQEGVWALLQNALLGKLDSSSGQERSMWNLQAWQTFIDTAGVGAGVGSARASSFVLVLLSNLGIIGSTLFLMFVWSCVGKALTAPSANSVAAASGQGVLALLCGSMASATVLDLGVLFYLLAGFAASGTCPQHRANANKQNVSTDVAPHLNRQILRSNGQ